MSQVGKATSFSKFDPCIAHKRVSQVGVSTSFSVAGLRPGHRPGHWSVSGPVSGPVPARQRSGGPSPVRSPARSPVTDKKSIYSLKLARRLGHQAILGFPARSVSRTDRRMSKGISFGAGLRRDALLICRIAEDMYGYAIKICGGRPRVDPPGGSV